MTESEFVQITTSFGLYPEIRGWSIVLAAYISKDYNSDWVAMYNNFTGTVRIKGYNREYVTPQTIKNLNKINAYLTLKRILMTKSNKNRIKIKNYYRVREALYSHFPKGAVVDYPNNYSVYLSAQYFFKDEGQTIILYYAQDRLLYPLRLEYVHNLPYYGYTGVACIGKYNNVISNYKDYLINLNPTPKDIEDLC